MPQPEHLDPTAYAADGGPIGALLIHGFPGSPVETRPMGQYLASHGLTVRCPLLPGHGTRPEDLIGVRWQAWAGEVEAALADLQGRCREVFVGGLSLGSLLTLWLGAGHPEIAGLVPMAPAIKIDSPLVPLTVALRHAIKYVPAAALPKDDLADPEAVGRIWCYDKTPMWGAGEVYLLQRQVLPLLPQIKQPMLILQGQLDTSVDPQAAQILYDRVGSADKELVWLEHSGHNLLVDSEREQVWARTCEWIMAHATEGLE
ncbi:MAG: alpha/beta hydrolase [Anaerolineae bacterium]